MGCDIHLCIEYRTRFVGPYRVLVPRLDLPRCYPLFAVLAGVRNNWDLPHMPQTGYDDVDKANMSDAGRSIVEDCDRDLHSLRVATLSDLDRLRVTLCHSAALTEGDHDTSTDAEKERTRATREAMNKLSHIALTMRGAASALGIVTSDIRAIYAFDNS